MALLLAPYNEAMRIGMGFNSYTQQLCVNDIVRKPGGKRASEGDLRSVDPTNGAKPTNEDRSKMLTSSSGEFVKKHGDQGQADVSQVVSWKAGFVDNLSDVTNSLNISGALSIKCAAINAGGAAHARFINTTKFLKSDAKYNIQVNVTNQKLIADDVIEFTPIPNVPASKFNDVYGDCFISGFIEGGVLNASILRTIVDESEAREIGGGLSLQAKLGIVDISGSAEGAKIDQEKKKKVETSITVSWSGGGDIKPDSIVEWDMLNMTKVAMEFPDKVALCPQRTYAILTKYTSLRSFYEQTVKGSPLDYEIAGIYTSSLLDAYMEYKAMWEDINITIKEIDQGKSLVKRREMSEKLISYRELIKTDFDKRLGRYNDAKTALAKSPDHNQVTLEEPLPPNEVDTYPADAFGIDKAARDCRFEMIKIVREVNEVSDNPKVATDPYRNWRFLSPHVFRLLLPTDKTKLLSPEEIAKLQADLQASIDECAKRQEEIDRVKADNTSLTQQVSGQQESSSASSAQATNTIRERDAKVQELTQRLNSIEAAFRDSQSRLEGAEQEANRYRREKDEAWNQLNAIPEVEVHSVVWGGRDITGDGNVVNRVKDNVRNNRPIPFTNDFFGCDPQYGQRKRGTVIYARRGRRMVKLEDWEGANQAIQ